MTKLTQSWRKQNFSIGFVPTMGYLHKGHLSLVNASLEDNGKTIVSIFVNPIQFGKGEDLESYPRDEKKDMAICRRNQVDVIFMPSEEEMYPNGFNTFVDVSEASKWLTGETRPGHFKGVCTVVSKLFNIVRPHKAYFGQKDAQQLAVIKTMTKDLNMDVEVIGCPTVREQNGLAMSSRNSYLDEKELQKATGIYKVLKIGRSMYENGKSSLYVRQEPMKVLEADYGLQTNYIHVVDPVTMIPRPSESIPSSGDLLMISVTIGNTTLIDNIEL